MENRQRMGVSLKRKSGGGAKHEIKIPLRPETPNRPAETLLSAAFKDVHDRRALPQATAPRKVIPVRRHNQARRGANAAQAAIRPRLDKIADGKVRYALEHVGTSKPRAQWLEFFCETVNPLSGVGVAHVGQVRRNSFFKNDGTTEEVGVALRSLVLFAWEKKTSPAERETYLARFIDHIIGAETDTVYAVPEEAVFQTALDRRVWKMWKQGILSERGNGQADIESHVAVEMGLDPCGEGNPAGEDEPGDPAESTLEPEPTSKWSTHPYAVEGIDPEEVRASNELLKTEMRVALDVDDVLLRRAAVKAATHKWRHTPFGDLAAQKLNTDGFVLVPLCPSADDAAVTTRRMREDVAAALLEKDGKRVQKRVETTVGWIKSQRRFMLDPIAAGRGFDADAGDLAETMRFVLLAIDYSNYDDVDGEKSTLLLSAEKILRQWLHRDQNLAEVARRMESTRGTSTRGGRGQPPAYSSVCAFQDGTALHVVPGSHLDRRDKFSFDEAIECRIPTGWGILFQGLLVHGGVASSVCHARLHLYIKTRGCAQAYTGKIQVVDGGFVEKGRSGKGAGGNPYPR